MSLGEGRSLQSQERRGSLGLREEDLGKYPFEAFSFDEPSDTAPRIYVLAPWELDRHSVGLPMGCLEGMALSNAADTDHDITVSAGRRRDASDTYNIVLASSLTKQIDAVWVAGTNTGGRFTDTLQANTTYHFFVIYNPTTGVVDAGFDASLTAANRPSGFTAYRWLGMVLTDAIANIIPGSWYFGNRQFRFKSIQVPQSNVSIDTSGALYGMGIPTGKKVEVFGVVKPGLGASNDDVLLGLSGGDEDYATPVDSTNMFFGTSRYFAGGFSGIATAYVVMGSVWFSLVSNTSGQIKIKRLNAYLSSDYQTTLEVHGYNVDVGEYDYVA